MLEQVFSRLRTANLKLNPKKCSFLKKEIKYLGSLLSRKKEFRRTKRRFLLLKIDQSHASRNKCKVSLSSAPIIGNL